MALVTTFATTPLVSVLFPPWYQRKLAAWKRGDIDWDGSRPAPADTSEGDSESSHEKDQNEIKRLLVSLRLDSLPSVFTFVALLGGNKASASISKSVHPSKRVKNAQVDTSRLGARPLEVHGLRMLELTERLSSVMKDSETDELSTRDPVVNAFRTFGQLNNVAVSGEIQLVPEGSYSEVLGERASERKSDMILLPWSETGSFSEAVTADVSEATQSAFTNSSYNHFIARFLDKTACNAAILVNNGFGALSREESRPALHRVPTNLSIRSNPVHATAPLVDQCHHMFLPYVGGLDDRVALRFILRLAKSPSVTATIVHMKVTDPVDGAASVIIGSATVGAKVPSTAVTSTSQEILHNRDQAFFTAMADSLPGDLRDRVLFKTFESTQPVHDSVEHARAEFGLSLRNSGDIVVVGRHQRMSSANLGHHQSIDSELVQSLGSFAEGMITSNMKASILIVQAGTAGEQE